MDEIAVLLLAGGQASRFPGKLERKIDGEPMLTRCYRHVRATGWPVYVAAKGAFPPALDAQIDAPMILDRRPHGGPLRAFLDACAAIFARRVFAIAADQPELDARVLQHLCAAWQAGDEAVVPQHGGSIEPLAALYDRRAALREALDLRTGGAMRDLVARLAARFVACDAKYFHNVNRPEDLLDR
jgi:molybdopterin-guanine dinucleotide biosynthesis protein A